MIIFKLLILAKLSSMGKVGQKTPGKALFLLALCLFKENVPENRDQILDILNCSGKHKLQVYPLKKKTRNRTINILNKILFILTLFVGIAEMVMVAELRFRTLLPEKTTLLDVVQSALKLFEIYVNQDLTLLRTKVLRVGFKN